MSSPPRLFNIAAGEGFLPNLARALADAKTRAAIFGAGGREAALGDIRIFVPTRRAVRALQEAFLDVELAARGKEMAALVLPRIQALGDLDLAEFDADLPDWVEDDADADTLLPAVSATERRFKLAQMIRDWAAADSARGHVSYRQSLRLAEELGGFLDQAQNDEVDWTKLPKLVPSEMALNWELTQEFLQILLREWPAYLAARGLSDAVARRNLLITRRAEAWARTPPPYPIIAAGSTGSIAATAKLLGTIARLPLGAVVLPGLDMAASDKIWQAIASEDTHPQTGLARLLDMMGARRDAVADWPLANATPAQAGRARFMQTALLPAAFTDEWARRDCKLDGVEILHAPDAAAEAGAIAVMMRAALQEKDKVAALVTPDRELARRVKAELSRWQIDVDDSAGHALALAEGAVLVQLVMENIRTAFAPVPLMALLKHPLVQLGRDRAAVLASARGLERDVLAGPRNMSGLGALIAHCRAAQKEPLVDLLLAVEAAFAPLVDDGLADNLAAHLDALLAVLAALSAPDASVWRGIAGAELARLFENLHNAAAVAGAVTRAESFDIIAEALAGARYRPQGRSTPRLFIWGPLEARLMQADLIILGGLNEGVWPSLPQSGPWLTRAMRAALGMASPERRIGLAAHDFYENACAGDVVLTRAEKQGGAPTIAARWLRRVMALAGGEIAAPKAQAALAWWRGMDACHQPQPAPPPAPCPPVAARPTRLSVTQIETLIANPYAIYARHILKLNERDPIDMPITPAHRGTYIHELLDRFTRANPEDLPPDMPAQFAALAAEMDAEARFGVTVSRFWESRLDAMFGWLAAFEQARRGGDFMRAHSEIKGEMVLETKAGNFTVSARADRIEQYRKGGYAIIDYKTGAPPSKKQVEAFFAPQLSLTAAILAGGGFPNVPKGAVAELVYVQLNGGHPPGREVVMPHVEGAAAMLCRLVEGYASPTQSYVAHLRTVRFGGAYDHLARLAEWQARAAEE